MSQSNRFQLNETFDSIRTVVSRRHCKDSIYSIDRLLSCYQCYLVINLVWFIVTSYTRVRRVYYVFNVLTLK